MKNPFIQKERDLNKKLSEWYRSKERRSKEQSGCNPYLKEALKLGAASYNWDIQRVTAIKETHNDSISEIAIDISPDLTLLLCPRVKLVYERISGDYFDPFDYEFADTVSGEYIDVITLADTIQMLFTMPSMSKKPIFIDLDDVKSDSPQCSKIAIFFRDLSFLHPVDNSLHISDKLILARDFLLQQKLTHFSMGFNSSQLVFEAVTPPLDDPHLMIDRFARDYPGYMKLRRPIIIVNTLVSHCPPNSSKSTRDILYEFFSVFGNIRSFDIQLANDSVSIEYELHEEFVDALKTLCCCSLRQDGSHELFDYEVALSCPIKKRKREDNLWFHEVECM